MIEGLTNSGSIPVLERLAQFAGARHRVITHNIANLSTPGFRPVDASVEDFQASLGEAVQAKRDARTPAEVAFSPEDTDDVEFHKDGIVLDPKPLGDNVLFHDQNDRDLDRTMQDLVENFMVFRQAMDLLRNRYELLNTAIRERI